MVQNKDFKRLVRARMRKTGESYTAARAQLQKKSSATPHRSDEPDYASLAGKSDAVIEQRTGRDWKEWTKALDSRGAQTLPHREIARIVSSEFGVADWWSQTVAVGYERIKGIREVGQRRDGSYEASKSRTFGVSVERLFAAWAKPGTRRKWLGDDAVKVRTATPQKTMRLGWPDGTVVVVGFMSKGKVRSAVAVQHTRLPSQDARDRAKQDWTERLDALAKVLSG